jgi:peptidoglycan/LPS O-acetylase OafA/YrhL
MVQRAEINQYEFIDALRGLAILLVVITHVASIAPPSLPVFRLIAANGAYGVQLFYVISALTLFLSTDQRSHLEKNPIRNFFIRRIFRIVPLFYLSVIAYTIVFGTGPNYWAPSGLEWWHYALTLLFLNGWHPEAINAIVPLGWSIAIEMTFYPLIPFLYKMVKDAAGAIALIVASLILQIVLVAIYKPFLMQYATGYIVQAYFYLWFFAQLPVFGLGILAYQILRNRPAQNKSLGGALVFLFLFMYGAFLQTHTYGDFIPAHFFYGIAFIVLTLGLYFNPIKVFVNPFTRWIGKISYSLYLVHYIFLPYLREWIILEVFGKTMQFALYVIFLLAISSGISYITYRFVELPSMDLGKKLIGKLEGKLPQATG